MDISFFLAKIMGIYFLIVGISILIKGRAIFKKMDQIIDNGLMYYLAIISLIIGLLIVGSHNIWTGGFEVILVTIIGWLALLKGAFYMIMPDKPMIKLLKVFSSNTWCTIGGIVAIIIGIYFVYTWLSVAA
ncbi:MAG: hypothetical protein V1865_03135 [bacterium]